MHPHKKQGKRTRKKSRQVNITSTKRIIIYTNLMLLNTTHQKKQPSQQLKICHSCITSSHHQIDPLINRQYIDLIITVTFIHEALTLAANPVVPVHDTKNTISHRRNIKVLNETLVCRAGFPSCMPVVFFKDGCQTPVPKLPKASNQSTSSMLLTKKTQSHENYIIPLLINIKKNCYSSHQYHFAVRTTPKQ